MNKLKIRVFINRNSIPKLGYRPYYWWVTISRIMINDDFNEMRRRSGIEYL